MRAVYLSTVESIFTYNFKSKGTKLMKNVMTRMFRNQ